MKAHSEIQPMHFLPINLKPQNHLVLQIRTTPHATSPHGELSTSCCIKASTHIKNHHLSRTEFAKKLWEDKPYCLRFDDVTMFTQP